MQRNRLTRLLRNTKTKRTTDSTPPSVSSFIKHFSLTVATSTAITTSVVITHHLWRKRHNSSARLGDYFEGTALKIRQIQQANQSWLRTYQSFNNPSVYTQNTQQATTKDASTGSCDIKYAQTIDTRDEAAHVSHVRWVSGVGKNGDADDNVFSVVGIDNDRQILWQTPLSERVHDIVGSPSCLEHSVNKRHVAVMGRRPSEKFWVLCCMTGKLLYAIHAQEHRHFYGHGCYSLDGRYLYVTENNTSNYQGVIGVYDVVSGYQKIDEFQSHGIGPHELILHPDGDKLVIANGGIKTDRASREELNLDSMQPSLVYLSLAQDSFGALLQQVAPRHNQMSIRHISAVESGSLKGTIAIGVQFQGDKFLNMPLVLTHRFGDDTFEEYQNSVMPTSPHTLRDDVINNDDTNDSSKNSSKSNKSEQENIQHNSDWLKFHQYIASIIINSQEEIVCITSPLGGYASIFDMNTQHLIGSVKIHDCAGIAQSLQGGFLVSDGQGGLTLIKREGAHIVTDRYTQEVAFDNHMQLVH